MMLYRCKRQQPNTRDRIYSASISRENLPSKASIKCLPAIYDQELLGSCTWNAGAAVIKHAFAMIGEAFEPSRLFGYHELLVLENGSAEEDVGGTIRGVMQVAAKGIASEDTCLYIPGCFRGDPSRAAYESAKKHKVVAYEHIRQNLDDLKSCIVEGFPFEFGMEVYATWEKAFLSGSDQFVEPTSTEISLGGHALYAVAYDNDRGFRIANSWGTDGGDHGYFWLPFHMLMDTKYCYDCWAIRAVKAF